MSKIERHISELLMWHNCVIVPRVGAFVASYRSASILDEGGLLTPPYKEIFFNPVLLHNDGLLISSYSQRHDLTYREAESEIDQFVDLFQKRLQNGEVVVFGEVGSFKYDLLGNLHFVQNKGVNFLPEVFGMQAVQSLEIKQLNSSERTIYLNNNLSKIVRSRRALALVAASMAMVFFTTTTTVKEVVKYETGSLVSINYPTSLNNSTQSVMSASLSATGNIETKGTLANVFNENGYFHLIGASVVSREEADAMHIYFKDKGFSDCSIVESDGRLRLSLKHFRSKSEAVSYMKKLRENNEFSSVWVYKK